MKRMSRRIAKALTVFPIELWTTQLARRKLRFAAKLLEKPFSWPALAVKWEPCQTNPHLKRARGRPKLRWDDDLSKFSFDMFGSRDWFVTLQQVSWSLEELEEHYIAYHNVVS